MLAIGRDPVTADMGFEDAGANLDRGFVTVDEYCQVGPEGLYAIGDIIPTLGLAHASFAEGFLVAERVAGQKVMPIDYAGIPKVYYCHPEIGAVGYTEQQLTDKGVEYDKAMFPFSHNGRAMMMKGTGPREGARARRTTVPCSACTSSAPAPRTSSPRGS